MQQADFEISRLGPTEHVSPMVASYFVEDDAGILLDAKTTMGSVPASQIALEAAGPRRNLFFDASKVKAAVVTCGGLCPGLNDVIRSITMVLWYRYGVRNIVGLRYGYEGLNPACGHEPMHLSPERVEDIHEQGGTILGSSRGPQDVGVMVDFLVANNINILFTIGGDGTQRGALELSSEAQIRKLDIAVIGVPKTIDNDVSYTERTFGFETAVSHSRAPIKSAHTEAKGAQNGVGLVKLMGRESGFVAAYAALASSDVNLLLVPEVPFTMQRVLTWLEERLARKSHAVIVAAEGAGQDLVATGGTDKSGNKMLGDIGLYLKAAIKSHFAQLPEAVAVKYIDPSYMIRSTSASADDAVFCFRLSENAVHAAMSGRTGMVVGRLNAKFVHIPMERAVEQRKQIDPHGSLWQSVLDNTGQPADLT